jgi:hypothetical protein
MIIRSRCKVSHCIAGALITYYKLAAIAVKGVVYLTAEWEKIKIVTVCGSPLCGVKIDGYLRSG